MKKANGVNPVGKQEHLMIFQQLPVVIYLKGSRV